MSTQLDPVLALALELRDSLRDVSKDYDATDLFESADQLLRMLINERGDQRAQLVLSKDEIGQLVHLRESMLGMGRNADEIAPDEIRGETAWVVETLDPVLDRFFDK